MLAQKEIEPDKLQTLWHVLDYYAEMTPDATALIFEEQRTSFAEARRQAVALAVRMLENGLNPGDRIAYLGKNSAAYFVLLFAAARIGCVVVPLNWRLSPDEWKFIITDSTSHFLFCDLEFLEQANGLSIGWPNTSISLLSPAHLPTADLPYLSLPNSKDVLLQVYTSGTTGRPKGVMLRHCNMLALRHHGYRHGVSWFPTADDISLVVLPIAHIAGTAFGVFGLYAGGCLCILREFDPEATLRSIEKYRASQLLLAPAAIQQIIDHEATQAADLSSLRIIIYGASPIHEALLRRALEMFGCGFVQMYGMTEAAGGAVALPPEDHLLDKPRLLRAAGKAMIGAEISVVDGRGNAVATGQRGEVVLRSESVMAGYWNNEAATAEVISPEGWLRTGDIGWLDEDGYLFLVDRAKDIIISGGENIYPAEVENAIYGHPDVADVAVIGIPSEKWGEEVMAVVVPREGARPTLASIAAWTRSRIAGFKVPRHLQLAERLPRNAGNKILRRVLREPFWTDHDRKV